MIHESNTSAGIGLPGAVFLVFLILKLTDKIDRSWWWVTSPLWLLPAIVLVVFLVVAFIEAVTT
jgi:hypothetical protein